ncbi:hypothetical protein AAZX31_03G054500 [Glycine max]
MQLAVPGCFSKGVWRFWRRTDYDTKTGCKRWHPWRWRSLSGGLLLGLYGEWSDPRWPMPQLPLLSSFKRTINCHPRLVVLWPNYCAPGWMVMTCSNTARACRQRS